MFPATPLGGQLCPAAESVNEAIRRLMSTPTEDRAEEYGRLLVRWAEIMQHDVITAA